MLCACVSETVGGWRTFGRHAQGAPRRFVDRDGGEESRWKSESIAIYAMSNVRGATETSSVRGCTTCSTPYMVTHINLHLQTLCLPGHICRLTNSRSRTKSTAAPYPGPSTALCHTDSEETWRNTVNHDQGLPSPARRPARASALMSLLSILPVALLGITSHTTSSRSEVL